MAYDFDSVGWLDWAGDIHWQQPTDVDVGDVAGLLVHYYDSDTGDEQWHWVYIDGPLDDWDDWDELIAGQMEQYGYPAA